MLTSEVQLYLLFYYNKNSSIFALFKRKINLQLSDFVGIHHNIHSIYTQIFMIHNNSQISLITDMFACALLYVCD